MIPKLLRCLEELAPAVRASTHEADRLARLPKEVSSALVRHELFRLWIPKRAAGLELSLGEALQVYEAAARLDGSVGWAVMIGSGGGLFAAYLGPEAAHALYSQRMPSSPDPDPPMVSPSVLPVAIEPRDAGVTRAARTMRPRSPPIAGSPTVVLPSSGPTAHRWFVPWPSTPRR